MKLLRSITFVAALAGASTTAFGQGAAPAKQPAKPAEKAPAKQAPAKPAPQQQEVSKADAERFLAFFNKFVDSIVATKDDCTKMATAMNKIIDDNQAMLKMAHDAKLSNKKLPKAYEEKMMARMGDLMPPMQKCGADPKVQAAMKRMEQAPAQK